MGLTAAEDPDLRDVQGVLASLNQHVEIKTIELFLNNGEAVVMRRQ